MARRNSVQTFGAQLAAAGVTSQPPRKVARVGNARYSYGLFDVEYTPRTAIIWWGPSDVVDDVPSRDPFEVAARIDVEYVRLDDRHPYVVELVEAVLADTPSVSGIDLARAASVSLRQLGYSMARMWVEGNRQVVPVPATRAFEAWERFWVPLPLRGGFLAGTLKRAPQRRNRSSCRLERMYA